MSVALKSRGRGRSRPRTRLGWAFSPAFEYLEVRMTPSTYTVSTTNDDAFTLADLNTATGQLSNHGNEVTLRSAIVANNQVGGGNTVSVPAGTYTLTIAGSDDTGLAGDLDVTGAVTITGAGSGTTAIQAGTTTANGIDKIFSFNPLGGSATGFAVSMSGVTLRFGRNQDTFLSGNGEGGAFDFDAGLVGGGSLALSDVIVDQNSTVDGDGGGMALFDGGTVTLTNCQVTNNTANTNSNAGIEGGGIFSGFTAAGTITMTGTTISGNTVNHTGAQGGGFFDGLGGVTANIHNCIISNNTATADGGGLDLGGTATIDQGTVISGNHATNGNGGGINAGGTVSVTGCVITNNTAGGNGGGVNAASGTLTMLDNRVVGNTAANFAAAAATGGATVSAANNWWGTNSPSATDYSAGVTFNPFIILSATAVPTPINTGGTSTLTASLTENNNNVTGFSVPDGTPVTFGGGALGTVNPSSTTTTGGLASSTFTAGAVPGTSDATVTVDNQTVTLPIPIQASVDLVVTKTGPATIIAGTQITYSVTVTNNGPDAATTVALTDTLPVGETFVSQTQDTGPLFTLSNVGNAISDSIATLANGATASFTFVASVAPSVAANSTLSNTADVAAGNGDSNNANNTSTVNTTVNTSADMAITKTGPATATAGTQITYTITITNNGPSDAQGVAVSDTILPAAGYTFVGLDSQSGPDSFNSVVAPLSFTATAISGIAPGSTDVFTITAAISNTVSNGTSLSNTATVAATTSDPNTGNNSSTAQTVVGTSADLAVTKAGPATIIAGTQITYTVSVTNNGPSDAQNVDLTDTLPVGETFILQTQDTGPAFTTSNVGNAISDTIGTLASGASASFTIVARVSASQGDGTTLSNTANIASSTTDPNNGNNSSTADTTVNTSADLAVVKTGPATAIAGTEITYTITATNNGPSDAAEFSAFDAPPAGTTPISFVQDSGPANFGPMPAGATAVFTMVLFVSASVPQGTILTNTAHVLSTITSDPNLNNNTFDVLTTVQTSADLATTKNGPLTAIAGTDATYTITVTNNGPSDAQNYTVSDAPPLGMTLVSLVQDSGPPEGGTLPAGATAGFTAVLHINASVPNNTVLTDEADVTSPTSDPNGSNNHATFSTTVLTQADVSITKSGPATVVAGTNVTYTITLTNNGPSDAQNVSMTDPFPAGTSTPASFQQLTGPSFSFSLSTTEADASATSLAAGASASFQLVVHSLSSDAQGSTITNTATVSTSTTDPNSGNNSATFTSNVITQADLVVTKVGTPNPVIAGTNLTYTVTVTDSGPSDAQNVDLADTLPAGLTFVSIVTSQGSGSGSGTSASASFGTIAAGATATATIVAHVSPSVPDGTLVTNTATASTTTTDPNGTNNTATADNTVIARADLAIVKTGPATGTAGLNVTYTLTATNNGPSDAQAYQVADSPPNGTSVVSFVQDSGPLDGGVMPAGATAVFTLVLHVSASVPNNTVITNTGTVSSPTVDPNMGNNTSSFNTTIFAVADLSITKVANPSPVLLGDNITYTVTVTNNGPSDAQSVTMQDAVPAGTTFVAETQTGGPTFTCIDPAVGSGGLVSCSIATLPAGDSATFLITVFTASRGLNGQSVSNTATVSTTTTDPNTGNNSVTILTPVLFQADMAVTKSGPSTIQNGQNITYTLTVTNNGPIYDKNVVLTDAIPTNTTFVSESQTSGPSFTCTTPVVGGTGTVSCSLAQMAQGASASFVLVVHVNAGTPNNTVVSNTANVSGQVFDPNLSNNSATVRTIVSHPTADLVITGSSSPAIMKAGGTGPLTYTIVVTNHGPDAALNVVVTDTLPSQVGFNTETHPAGWTSTHPALGSSGNVTWSIGSLAAGASVTFTIIVKATPQPSGFSFVDTATVTSSTTDPNPGDDTIVIITPVR